MSPFWIQVEGKALAQGDMLPDCLIPVFPSEYRPGADSYDVQALRGDLVVMTQSCDLENSKVEHVATCPIMTIGALASEQPELSKPHRLEEIRKGRFEFLHMLASPTTPESNRDALIVDFRQIVSLPVAFLSTHAGALGKRWRLTSPFLEHFSQAFARFFMRVGLPSSIPKFK